MRKKDYERQSLRKKKRSGRQIIDIFIFIVLNIRMKKKIASKAMVFILLSVLVLPVRLYCDNMSGLALPFLYWPAEIILCLLFGLIVFLSITRMKTESRGVVFVVLEIL